MGTEAEEAIRAELLATVAIELLVENADPHFRIDEATLPEAAAIASPVHLTADGARPLPWREPPVSGSFRTILYLRGYAPGATLGTSYGELLLPSPQDMPERISQLAPFEPRAWRL